jgi:two-component system CheB/CheR fusion protein
MQTNDRRVSPAERLDARREAARAYQARGTGEQVPFSKKRFRVLVVDDDGNAADALAALVRTWGYDATATCSSAQALAAAWARPPDVVLIDFGGPKAEGFPLARLLRRQVPIRDILFVALTRRADIALSQCCASEGFACHLVKPADLDLLQSVLARRRVTYEA